MMDEVVEQQDLLSPVSTMTMGTFPEANGPEGPRAADWRRGSQDIVAEAPQSEVPTTVEAEEEVASSAGFLSCEAFSPRGYEPEPDPEPEKEEEVEKDESPRSFCSCRDTDVIVEEAPVVAPAPTAEMAKKPSSTSAKSLLCASEDDEDDEEDAGDDGKVRKRVAFVEQNPTPLSPLSIPPGESMTLSPRNDDEETLTLDLDPSETLTFEEDTNESNRKQSLLSRAAGRPLKSPKASTPSSTQQKGAPVVDMIPDDESEASLLVLMRYMGCTPMAYGQGPLRPKPGTAFLDESGRPIDPSGKEFVFEFEEDNNSILSDEETYQTYDEGTYTTELTEQTAATPEPKKAATPEPKTPSATHQEEGVEMELDDLCPVSPPLEKTPKTKVGKDGTKKSKKPNLTVETQDTTKRKKKIKNLLGDKDTESGVLSDEAMHIFLSSPKQDSVTSPTKPELVASPAMAALLKYTEDLRKDPKNASAALENFRKQTSGVSADSIEKFRSQKSEGSAESKITTESDEAPEAESESSKKTAGKTDMDSTPKKKKTKKSTKKKKKKKLSIDTLQKPLADNLSPVSAASVAVAEQTPLADALSPTSAAPAADVQDSAADEASDEPIAKDSAAGEASDEPMAAKPAPASSEVARDALSGLSVTATTPSVRQLASALSPRNDAAEVVSPMSVLSDDTAKLIASATAAMSLKENSESQQKRNDGESTRADMGKIEESPTARSDKENSSDEEPTSQEAAPATKAPLTVKTGSSSAAQTKVLSPTKQSVQEVDAFLSKTRDWLVRHNEAQATKRDEAQTNKRAFPSLSTPSQRKVMGNITAKTVLNPKNANSPIKSPSLKEQLLQSKVALDVATGGEATPLSSPSIPAPSEAPKKSIMEQLNEIRAKQREIEAKQLAKKKELTA